MSGNGPYFLVLTTSVSGTTVTANLSWRRNSWGYTSYNSAASWSLTIDGTTWSGTVNFDAPAGGARSGAIASRSKNVGSKSSVAVSGSFQTGTSDGGSGSISASVVVSAVPPAPSPIGLDQITQTSMRYRFQSTGTGSSPIIRWEYQYSTDPAFAGALLVTSSGTSVQGDLTPGTKYYFRSRGVNSSGAGPWSAASSATTLPGGLRVAQGGQVPVVPLMEHRGATDTQVQLFIISGGVAAPLG